MGEGWIAPPIPAKLVKPKAMSAGDLDYLPEQELGELEEEETDEQTGPVEIGEEKLQAEREQSGERIEENVPRPPMIEGYLLLEENVQTWVQHETAPPISLTLSRATIFSHNARSPGMRGESRDTASKKPPARTMY